MPGALAVCSSLLYLHTIGRTVEASVHWKFHAGNGDFSSYFWLIESFVFNGRDEKDIRFFDYF